jgi:hypothetical protein
MLAEEEARKAFKSSAMITRSPRKKVIPPSLRIPDAPKKMTARPTIKENEENEPSTPTRPSPNPATKPAEPASTIKVSKPVSSPIKTLIQTAIRMIKRSKNKLSTQKQSAGLRDEVVGELDEFINFMEAVHTIEDNMANVQRELKEVKETVIEAAKAAKETAKTAPHAWAAIAAKPRASDHHEHYHKQELDEQSQQKQAQRRQERAKCQVTLTAEGAPGTMQSQLGRKDYAELTKDLQEAVDDSITSGPTPMIEGFQILKSNDIRFSCNSKKEAQRLREIDWSKAFPGLKVRQPRFGIVIHGIPIEEINPCTDNLDDIAVEIGSRNDLKIAKLRTLRAPSKRDPAARSNSFVILTHDADAADKCLKKGIFLNCRLFNTEKYTPQYQLTQCYKCQRYGHKAGYCRGKEKCGRCGDNHTTKDCETNVHKCANCGDDHPAWHPDCPRRREESKRLDELKFKIKNAYYNE